MITHLYLILLTLLKLQQTDLNFKTNVNTKGYNMFTNGSNSQKGGVAIYVNNQ